MSKKTVGLIRFTALIFVVMAECACQKRTPLLSLSWQNGEPAAGLNQITALSTKTEPGGINYKNKKYEFRQQTLNEKPIEDTFVKLVSNGSSEIQSAQAKYVATQTDHHASSRASSHAHSGANGIFIQLQKINEKSAPLQIRKYESEERFKLVNGVLKNFQVLQYELNDGTLWQAHFDANAKLQSLEKLGSQFSETEAQVYTKGPKQSALTEVILKGLELSPSISNQNILVDTESTVKITSLFPQLKFETQDERFDQVQVFFYLDFIQNWMKEHLAVQFPQKLQAVVAVGYPDLTNTAFYFQNKIRFGRGDNVDYTMMAADPSIVYHESFHALIDGLARLPFEGEGGSMNEGFADFFACIVLDRPYLGESAFMAAPYKRTIKATIRRNETNGGLYHDSQILSSLLWEIKEKIGSDKSLKLAVETLAQLNPASKFDDFNRQLVKVSTAQLSSEDRLAVANTLKTRGFFNE